MYYFAVLPKLLHYKLILTTITPTTFAEVFAEKVAVISPISKES